MNARILAAAAVLIWCFAVPVAGQERAWPGYVNGRPTIEARSDLGFFVWHDGDGWHVRWTTGGRTRAFSGDLNSDGAFYDVNAVRTEKGDVNVRTARELLFRATSTGGIDGFDFRTRGDRVSFRLRIDGSLADRGHVSVGAAGVHPGNPFTVTR